MGLRENHQTCETGSEGSGALSVSEAGKSKIKTLIDLVSGECLLLSSHEGRDERQTWYLKLFDEGTDSMHKE